VFNIQKFYILPTEYIMWFSEEVLAGAVPRTVYFYCIF